MVVERERERERDRDIEEMIEKMKNVGLQGERSSQFMYFFTFCLM